jgi:hypothetical protein
MDDPSLPDAERQDALAALADEYDDLMVGLSLNR